MAPRIEGTLLPAADATGGSDGSAAPAVGETHIVDFVGDEQYFGDPEFMGVYRSITILDGGPPGIRYPGQTLGIPYLHEEIMRQAIPEELMPLYQGMISTGDIADVCSVEEIKEFVLTLARLKDEPALQRMLIFMIGNHDVLHSGNFYTGSNFFGILGLVLNVATTEQSYRKDIFGAEVGGTDNILDKKKLVDFIYKYIFEHDPRPALLEDTLLGSNYRLMGQAEKKWSDTETAFKDFWTQEKDGSYNCLVKFKPTQEDLPPEKQYFYSSAVKMEDLETSNGNHPVYFINLDTMDFLGQGTTLGGTQGHVSGYQVHAVQALIAHIKLVDKGAKFMLGGHFPLIDIVNIIGSGLNEILSDNDVIAYVGAHTHDRGYKNLNSPELARKYNIHRNSDLPMIITPSVMDYPNEILVLKYGVEDPATDKLYFEFTHKGVDPMKVPGLSEDVKDELRKIWPDLNTFAKALAHFDDVQLAEIADPRTNIGRKLEILLNLDEGILSREGNAQDTVVAHDVIPTMVQNNLLYKKLFLGITKLGLKESGLPQEADNFATAYEARLNTLNNVYESIYSEDAASADFKHANLAQMDSNRQELDDAIDTLEYTLTTMIASDSYDETKISALQNYISIARLMQQDLEFFKDWLIQYELIQRTKRSDAEVRGLANLFGNGYFKSIKHKMRDIPYGSGPTAYMTEIGLKSAKMYHDFRQTDLVKKFAPEQDVPDQIRLEIDTRNNSSSITTKDLPYSPEHNLDALELELGVVGKNEYDQPKLASTVSGLPPAPIPFERDADRTHTNVSFGAYKGDGSSTYHPGTTSEQEGSGYNNGLNLEVGGTYHAVDQWNRPRVDLYAGLGTSLEWQQRKLGFDGGTYRQDNLNWELPVTGALTVGDPWGLVNLGPAAQVGGSLRAYDNSPFADGGLEYFPSLLLGAGAQAGIGENLFWVRYMHQWHINPEQETGQEDQFMISMDLLTAGRALNLLPRGL